MIGAGVGGLSCARRLAQHGIETLVVERGTVAGGASGRNGGFLLAGIAAFHVDARERLGAERARALYQRTLDAQQEVYELAAELGAADAVRRVGLLRASASEEEAEHVRRHAEALRADGFPAQLLERDELPPALRRGFFNGCLTENDGALHPARWIRALAGAAEQAGARICEGTPVRAPVRAPYEADVLAGGQDGAREARDRGERRRAPGAGPALRRPRSGAAPAHGGHRAAPRARAGAPALLALGLRVRAADARTAACSPAASATWTVRALTPTSDEGSPAGVGADRELARRRSRGPRAGHASLGRNGGLHATTVCPTSARCPRSRGCMSWAATQGMAMSPATWPGRRSPIWSPAHPGEPVLRAASARG